MTDKQITAEGLRGPWQACLTDDYGFVLDNLDDSDPADEVRISIRRGSALPKERHGNLRLPGDCLSGDVIDLWDGIYVEDGDPSTDAAARWAQAQAMAAGLNAAGSAQGYLIWSHHHDAWFAPNARGYRSNVADAGRFSLADASRYLNRGCDCCKVPEVVTPVPLPGEMDRASIVALIARATQAEIDAGRINKHCTKAEVPA